MGFSRRRVVDVNLRPGTRVPKAILDASRATVQARVLVHEGTALVTAR